MSVGFHDAPSQSILGRTSRARYEGVQPSSDLLDQIDLLIDATSRGDLYQRNAAVAEIVRVNRIDHASAGLPVFAHSPLPEPVARFLVRPFIGLPDDQLGDEMRSIVAGVPLAARVQVSGQLSAAARDGASANDEFGDPESDEAIQRADALDESDPIARVAHPPAYAFDEVMNDLAGPDGVFGDWGWRKKVPKPKGAISRAAADAIRFYLETGPSGLGRARGLFGAVERGTNAVGRVERGGAAAGRVQQAERSGSRVEREMARRPFTCQTSCHCYQIPGSKAQCPSFVRGVGIGADTRLGCRAAKAMAGAQVPKGCGYRHCN